MVAVIIILYFTYIQQLKNKCDSKNNWYLDSNGCLVFVNISYSFENTFNLQYCYLMDIYGRSGAGGLEKVRDSFDPIELLALDYIGASNLDHKLVTPLPYIHDHDNENEMQVQMNRCNIMYN